MSQTYSESKHEPLRINCGGSDGVPICREQHTKRCEQLLTEETVETWTFSWYEDLFAQDAGTKSVVNVASKVYRRIALYEPGEYTVTLNYYDGEQTEAKWLVRPLAEKKRAKNVIFFIGEYLERNNPTAADLLKVMA